jgi:hypothetical protein
MDGVSADQLDGLRRAWVNPPSPAVTLASLRAMGAAVLALDERDKVVGFVCGMTDGLFVLYVWDLEVAVPDPEGRIARELLRRLLGRYGRLYQVNAHPSGDREELFASLGFERYPPQQAVAMTKMHMPWQGGTGLVGREG